MATAGLHMPVIMRYIDKITHRQWRGLYTMTQRSIVS